MIRVDSDLEGSLRDEKEKIFARIEPIPKPAGEGEEWHKQFFGFYLDRVAQHMKQFPADLGFNKGFWDGNEGLSWYQR